MSVYVSQMLTSVYVSQMLTSVYVSQIKHNGFMRFGICKSTRWVSLAGAVASLVGIIVYNVCLKKAPLRPMLVWCTLLVALLGSTDLILVSGLNRKLGISDEARGGGRK